MARTLKAESVDKGKALTNTRFVVLFVEACHLKNDKKTFDIRDWVIRANVLSAISSFTNAVVLKLQ